jgi:hypothetical protein
MRFEQTHQILNNIRDFHSALSECYQHLQDESDRERSRLLLDYLVTREKELANALQNFMNEADHEVLDTWFQFADESELIDLLCPVVNTETCMDIDEIMQLAKRAHECLIRVFDLIIANCEAPNVCDVFDKLRAQANKQWLRLVHETNLLADL